MRNSRSIIEYFTKETKEGKVIDHHEWMQAAKMLSVLIGTEREHLFELQQIVAKIEYQMVETGATSAKAREYVKTRMEWLDAKKQESFVKQIDEFIKIAKLHARLSQSDFQNQL